MADLYHAQLLMNMVRNSLNNPLFRQIQESGHIDEIAKHIGRGNSTVRRAFGDGRTSCEHQNPKFLTALSQYLAMDWEWFKATHQIPPLLSFAHGKKCLECLEPDEIKQFKAEIVRVIYEDISVGIRIDPERQKFFIQNVIDQFKGYQISRKKHQPLIRIIDHSKEAAFPLQGKRSRHVHFALTFHELPPVNVGVFCLANDMNLTELQYLPDYLKAMVAESVFSRMYVISEGKIEEPYYSELIKANIKVYSFSDVQKIIKAYEGYKENDTLPTRTFDLNHKDLEIKTVFDTEWAEKFPTIPFPEFMFSAVVRHRSQLGLEFICLSEGIELNVWSEFISIVVEALEIPGMGLRTADYDWI